MRHPLVMPPRHAVRRNSFRAPTRHGCKLVLTPPLPTTWCGLFCTCERRGMFHSRPPDTRCLMPEGECSRLLDPCPPPPPPSLILNKIKHKSRPDHLTRAYRRRYRWDSKYAPGVYPRNEPGPGGHGLLITVAQRSGEQVLECFG